MLPKHLNKLIERRTLCLATSTKDGKPNAILCKGQKFINGTVLIADVSMNKTIKNIKQNKRVALIAWNGNEAYQFKGTAKYFAKGKWLEMVKRSASRRYGGPKGAILIKITECYNLETYEKLL